MASGIKKSFRNTRAALEGMKDYIENCNPDIGVSVNVLNSLHAVLFDIKTEIEVLKGAMILDGYEPEDSCIHFLDDMLNADINPLYTECKKLFSKLLQN